MHFGLNEDQTALRDAVREVLDRECSAEVVRAAWRTESPSPLPALWHRLAQVGVLGMLVPDDRGGLGLDETYLVPMLEETGRFALPGPTVEAVAVAAPLLAVLPAHDDLVDGALSGDLVITCDLSGSGLVPYGQIADVALVWLEGDLRLLRLEAGDLMPEQSIDGARKLARVDSSRGVVLDVDPGDVAAARLRGALGSAAELVGLGRRMIDMTVSYVKERHQFGVPVGSFQAVKHHLANALLAIELAAPTVHQAAWSVATHAATRERDTSVAKALASDAARRVAALTLQCHGAMAYTTEYDHHLFAKRAWVQAAAWGSADWHRERVAEALGLEGSR